MIDLMLAWSLYTALLSSVPETSKHGSSPTLPIRIMNQMEGGGWKSFEDVEDEDDKCGMIFPQMAPSPTARLKKGLVVGFQASGQN